VVRDAPADSTTMCGPGLRPASGLLARARVLLTHSVQPPPRFIDPRLRPTSVSESPKLSCSWHPAPPHVPQCTALITATAACRIVESPMNVRERPPRASQKAAAFHADSEHRDGSHTYGSTHPLQLHPFAPTCARKS